MGRNQHVVALALEPPDLVPDIAPRGTVMAKSSTTLRSPNTLVRPVTAMTGSLSPLPLIFPPS
jgi:hypothetical protein